MTITEARAIILTMRQRGNLLYSEMEALSLADQALKTIQDMKTKGAAAYGNLTKL